MVVLLALATAHVAEGKGQSGLLWFVLGLFFPGVSLLFAALLRPLDPGAPVVPSAAEATRASPVARALRLSPGRSAHEVASLTEQDQRVVVQHLAALEDLGMAQRDANGRWNLTAEGRRHVDDHAAG